MESKDQAGATHQGNAIAEGLRSAAENLKKFETLDKKQKVMARLGLLTAVTVTTQALLEETNPLPPDPFEAFTEEHRRALVLVAIAGLIPMFES